MKKSLLFLLLTALCSTQGIPQVPPAATQGTATQTGTIKGRVVRIGTSDPIPGVHVELARRGGMSLQQAQFLVSLSGTNPQPSPEAQRMYEDARAIVRSGTQTATSDSNGEFTFTNVPSGTHDLKARLAGYFGTPVRGNYPGEFTQPVTVTTNEVATTSLSLIPAGTISGRVLDPKGQPLVDAPVDVARLAYRNGVVWGQALGNYKTTNDRGEYRIFGLPPGEYYLAADAETRVTQLAATAVPTRSRLDAALGRDVSLTTFYPNSTDITAAQRVEVRPGQELTGVDIQIQTAVAARISGKVTSTQPAGALVDARGRTRPAAASVSLIPRHVPISVFFSSRVITANPDGVFEIPNVTPGIYDVLARFPVEANNGWETDFAPDRATNPWAFGRTTVEVRGENIDNVAVVVHKGNDVTGRLIIDGKPSPANVRIALRLTDLENTTDIQARSTLQAIADFFPPIQEDGSFTIPFIPEGHYRFSVQLSPTGGVSFMAPSSGLRGASSLPGLPPTAYVEDIRLGSLSVYDNGLTVGKERLNPIDVLIRTSSGRVEGTVAGPDQKPAAGIEIALVPAPNRRQNPALYRRTLSDAEGRFTVNNVPPGAYTAYAWENAPPGAGQNAEFLSRYSGRGAPVNVTAGASASVTVTLIR